MSTDIQITIDRKEIEFAKGIEFELHLSSGAFSDVYLAKYKNEKIALKVLHKNKIHSKHIKQHFQVLNILKVILFSIKYINGKKISNY